MTHSRNPRSAKYVPPDGGDKIAQVQADDYALDDMRKDHSASSPPRASAGLGGGGDNDDGEAPPPDYKDDLAHHSSRDAGSVLDLDGGDNGGFGPAGDGSDGGSIEEGEVYRLYKRRWFGLVAIIFLNIIASWDWLTFSPISQHAAEYYGTSESTINWLSTGFLFTFVAVSPVTIWMLHWGVKPSIVTSAALSLVGNWVRYGGSAGGGGGSGTIGVVIFGQVLCGASQTFVLSAPTRYSDLWFSARGRVAATAVMSLANPFGAALGQLLIPMMVAGPADVPDAVLYVAAIATAIAVPACLVPAAPPTPPEPSGATPKEPLPVSLRRIVGSLEIWLLLVPFAVYVGLFNSVSTILNQAMEPHGFSSDEAGIAGAVLIVVGLVASAVASPVLDRTKAFLLALRAFVPVIGLCYLAFVWMPATGGLAGPLVVLGLLGAASFSLVPVALEYLCELAHPCSPEVTSTLAWAGGQLLGGCFVLVADALKAGPDAAPPANLDNGLVFHAVVALAAVPVLLCLGLFGRQEHVKMRRTASDTHARRPGGGRHSPQDATQVMSG